MPDTITDPGYWIGRSDPAGARNRPTSEPGGMECSECGCIFIGAEWHMLCGHCVKIVGDANGTR